MHLLIPPPPAPSPRPASWSASAVITLLTVLLASCSSYRVKEVPSVNFNERVRYLILHYTSEDSDTSLRLLTQPSSRPVSAHYLIDVPGADGDVPVYRLVEEQHRAWHAGRSFWGGEAGLNSASIGIEIVNESRCAPPAATLPSDASAPAQTGEMTPVCRYLPYPDAQIETLIALARDILDRHPSITPERVLGHGDIAPLRKVDPGPQFPWRQLHEAGIGAWYEADRAAFFADQFAGRLPPVSDVQRALSAWGFHVPVTGILDEATTVAVGALQMHFRPAKHDGVLDLETVAVLFALLDRYMPDQLPKLLATTAGESTAPDVPPAKSTELSAFAASTPHTKRSP